MMHRAIPKHARQVCALGRIALIALIPAACGVAESTRVSADLNSGASVAGCSSALGSYALPKAHLHVQITQTPPSPPQLKQFGTPAASVETLRHVDPTLVFCLDYLSSVLSHDKITIKKTAAAGPAAPIPSPPAPAGASAAAAATPSGPFLSYVMVNAVDRSVYVVEALVRAAFIAASGNKDFSPDAGREAAVQQTLADLEYDPFDPDDSAAVNDRLTKLGYCLVLENYTFNRQGPSVSRYCNSPRTYPSLRTFFTKAYLKAQAAPADTHLPGLLYRPRVPYRLEIYRKVDAGGSDPWQLSETMTVNLENMSPVLALDLRRAAFAARTATFVFESGTLKAACVSKSSEVEGFVDIPLQISKSLVALPGSIATAQLSQITSQQQLVAAEQGLYQVQKAYMTALAGGTLYQAPSGAQTTLPTYPAPIGTGNPPALPVNLGTGASEPAAPVYGDATVGKYDLFGKDITSICQGQ